MHDSDQLGRIRRLESIIKVKRIIVDIIRWNKEPGEGERLRRPPAQQRLNHFAPFAVQRRSAGFSMWGSGFTKPVGTGPV